MKNPGPMLERGSTYAQRPERQSKGTPPILALVTTLAYLTSCSPPAQRPTGWAQVYDDAKVVFGRGQFEKALDFTDPLVTAKPANAYTERGRVLRVVVLSGFVKGYKELADAYQKGVETTRDARIKSENERLRHDYRQYGAKRALGLAEVSHQLTEGGTISKELTLDAPFPAVEGPVVVAQLNRVMEGGGLEPGDEEVAVTDALRKGIDDALAEIAGGDRAKARTTLTAGPLKMNGVDFALYLGNQLLTGASIFDLKHMRDAQKLSIMCGQADEAAKAALDLLKANPDKAKEKEVKKLQDKIKSTSRNI